MTGKARDLGTRGRVILTAVSVGAAGVLAGWMAASDHTATATTSTGAAASSSAGSSTGSSSDDRGFADDDRPTATPSAGSSSNSPTTGGVSPPVARTRRELMTSHFWWYTTRAAGLVAWGLVVASCACGLMLALHVKVLGIRPTAAWTLSLHRWLSALAVTFTAVHVLALIADDFVHFGVTDVLVPFVTTWHPVAVAWGIVSMYLLVAIEATSLLRARLPQRVWHSVHLCSYVLLGATTIHLLTAGTDSTTVIPEAIAVLLGMFAVFSTVMLLTWRAAPKQRRIVVSAPAQAPGPDDRGLSGGR